MNNPYTVETVRPISERIGMLLDRSGNTDVREIQKARRSWQDRHMPNEAFTALLRGKAEDTRRRFEEKIKEATNDAEKSTLVAQKHASKADAETILVVQFCVYQAERKTRELTGLAVDVDTDWSQRWFSKIDRLLQEYDDIAEKTEE